jgi:hypothetical protein
MPRFEIDPPEELEFESGEKVVLVCRIVGEGVDFLWDEREGPAQAPMNRA